MMGAVTAVCWRSQARAIWAGGSLLFHVWDLKCHSFENKGHGQIIGVRLLVFLINGTIHGLSLS